MKLLILLFALALFAEDHISLEFPYRTSSFERESLPASIVVSASSDAEVETAPLQLIVAVDISERSSGSVLEGYLEGVTDLASTLRDEDYLGVILYSEFARVVFPLSQLTPENREQLQRSISAITTATGRNMDQILPIVEEQFSLRGSGVISDRVLLVTGSGSPTGLSGDPLKKAFSNSTKSYSYRVFTLAYGRFFDESLYIGLAENNGGEALYVPENEQVRFAEEFSYLKRQISLPVLRDISLEFDTQTPIKVWGSEIPFESISISALPRGGQRYIFVEVYELDNSGGVDLLYSYTPADREIRQGHISATPPPKADAVVYKTESAARFFAHSILFKLDRWGDALKNGGRDYRRSFASGFREDVLYPLQSIVNAVDHKDMNELYSYLNSFWDKLMQSSDTDIHDLIKEVRYRHHGNSHGRD